MSYIIIGVVGHIDHGKTSLVAALTGVDTDTHPEEKRRGITIDLGFASFTEGDRRFAFIDAPGHQKYIGNLLAGVAAVDVGILVVACDQGIQEQTLEHASILHLLGIRQIIVVLSRTDLATEEQRRDLRETLELYLDDFGFTDVPMVEVSVVNGTGIDVLKETLCKVSDGIPEKSAKGHFRMPVDRVFTMPGRGCVLAGTIWSGTVHRGDSLYLHDARAEVRVRNIEVHGQSVDVSTAGFRTALNVTGASAQDVERGDELILPEYRHEASRCLVIDLKTLKTSPPLKCPAVVQMHLAARTCSARLTGVRRLTPGDHQVVVVETEHKVVAEMGQRCLFRLPYPVGTLGGGTVLAVIHQSVRKSRKLIELGEQLRDASLAERLAAWVNFLGEAQIDAGWMEQHTCQSAAQLTDAVIERVCGLEIDRVPGPGLHLVSGALVHRVEDRMMQMLAQRASESENAWCAREAVLEAARRLASSAVVDWIVESMMASGRIVQLKGMMAAAGEGTVLSKKQQARLEQIMQMFDGNRSPPTVKEIAAELGVSMDAVNSLCRFGIQSGMILDAGNGFLISAAVFRELCTELAELFSGEKQLSVSQIKDRWKVTRKHAVPFLEYCDTIEITIRHENLRSAGPRLKNFVAVGEQKPVRMSGDD